jgi:HSP20 family protein
MFAIQDDIDRMFEQFAGRRPENDDGLTSLAPAADVIENKDNFLVTAELPGIRKEDIKVSIQDNVLTISGEKKRESETKGRTWHRVEREFGSFIRSFELPTTVHPDKIKADFKDGVLNVEIPKVEEAKPKEIAVNVR